ncbi:MAG: ATP-binding protein [Myxococcales bacterium]
MQLGVAGRGDDGGLASRLAWVAALRLGMLVLLLIAVGSLYFRGALLRYPFSLRIVFATLGGAFALAASYAVVLRRGRNLSTLAYTQIVLDQLTWTVVVWVTGGVASGATSFYGLSCLMGAILVGLPGAIFASATGLALYTALCASLYFGWLRQPHDQASAAYASEVSDVVYSLLVNSLGVVVVALLAGYLAERLRITGGALALATRRAVDAERLAVLGRIAAGLAHEIRNPLGSIRGSTELLRESSELCGEDKHLCEIIHREASRLNHLVDDMMNLAKPRAPHPESVDVAALAREVVLLATHAERGSDVAVVYEGPEGVVRARCDGAQMRQVLWNLVRNALQASPHGAQVEVRVERTAKEVVLAVDDHGPGIAPEGRDRIFDPFFTTRSHGAGIGLAVVRRVMDDHASVGARLEVVSAAEGGASFRVTLRGSEAGSSIRPPRHGG